MNKSVILITLFSFVAIASGFDLAADSYHGASMQHIIKEGIIILLSILAIAWMMFEIHQQTSEIRSLKAELETTRKSDSLAKSYILEGRKQLSQAIHQQFNDWQLTISEAEVGWLLLKGLSLKEIAYLRETTEKTVRQQASSIYKKADIKGRHAFSAWFIEDILQ